MPKPFVQGLDLVPQATRQTRSKIDSDQSFTMMFGTVLKSLLSSKPDELIDPQDQMHQHADTDDGPVTQEENSKELLQDLTGNFSPLALPIATQEAGQQMHGDLNFASDRGLALVSTADRQSVQKVSDGMQVSPEGEEYIATFAIGTAYRALPRSNEEVERKASTHLKIERSSLVGSPGVNSGEIRSDNDVLASHPGSSTDPDPLSTTHSLPATRPTDQPMTSAPIEPSPARQLLSIIEFPLRPHLASHPFAIDTRTQSEEVRVLRMTLRPADLGEVEVTLRRRGTEMQIRIVVSKQAAADALQGDLSFLKERISTLLPVDGTHSVSILMSPYEGTASSWIPSHFQRENDSIYNGQGGLPSGGGERPPPRKEDAQSIVESERYDKDTPPQLGASGIIV